MAPPLNADLAYHRSRNMYALQPGSHSPTAAKKGPSGAFTSTSASTYITRCTGPPAPESPPLWPPAAAAATAAASSTRNMSCFRCLAACRGAFAADPGATIGLTCPGRTGKGRMSRIRGLSRVGRLDHYYQTRADGNRRKPQSQKERKNAHAQKSQQRKQNKREGWWQQHVRGLEE